MTEEKAPITLQLLRNQLAIMNEVSVYYKDSGLIKLRIEQTKALLNEVERHDPL